MCTHPPHTPMKFSLDSAASRLRHFLYLLETNATNALNLMESVTGDYCESFRGRLIVMPPDLGLADHIWVTSRTTREGYGQI